MAILAVVIVWAVLTVPKPPSEEDIKKEQTKYMEYGPNTIREEQNGKLIWEIVSESSRMNLQTKETEMNKITAKYYQANGNVLTLTAPKGYFDEKTQNIKLTDGVKAINTDKSELTSKELEWTAKEGRLVAAGAAKLVKEDLEVSGDKLEAWDDFEQFSATGHAHIVRKNLSQKK